MKPLTVRRAECFEKILFLGTAAVGAIGAVVGIVGSPVQISGALGAVLGSTAAGYFAFTMAIPGVLGFWTVRHSQRDRGPALIESECRAERWGLAGMGVGWSGYCAAAAAVGFPAVAITIILSCICIGCVWRMLEIHRDLRKMHHAMKDPRPADPPPIAEGP